MLKIIHVTGYFFRLVLAVAAGWAKINYHNWFFFIAYANGIKPAAIQGKQWISRKGRISFIGKWCGFC